MGFSLLAEALLAAHLQHASWTGVIPKFGYSVGFLIVILGRRGVLGIWAVILAANYHAPPESRVCCRFASKNCHNRKRGRFQIHENK
jgi:hypothetical protein